MPSHKIHIAIAQSVNKKLNLDNDEISIGSILPDVALVEHHGISHFQYINEYPHNLANPDEFIKIYKEQLDSAISIGYLIHLLTDRFYTEKYYRKFYIFENNKPIKLLLNNEEITDNKLRKYIKQHDFHEYDKYLINQNIIILFKNKKVIEKIPKYENIEFDLNYLEAYIEKNNMELQQTNINYEFLYWNKFELDDIYNECIKYILDYIKKNLDRVF